MNSFHYLGFDKIHQNVTQMRFHETALLRKADRDLFRSQKCF